MKGKITRIAIVALTLIAMLAAAFTMPGIAAADSGRTVDIGNLVSEGQAGIGMAGWGLIEPANSGGGYGGVTDCRVMWEPVGNPSATVTYVYEGCVYPTNLEWRALDGIANDSYQVYVDGTLVYTYTDGEPINDPEAWYTVTQSLTQFKLRNDVQHVVEFVATGPAWDSFGTYGQGAIDWVTITTAPCAGNTNVGVEVVVRNPECICIDITPSFLNFGALYPGQSNTILDALTIGNCGNVPVKVTASTTSAFYSSNLYFASSPWTLIGTWTDIISVSASDTIDARLDVPVSASSGTVAGQIVFWAQKN